MEPNSRQISRGLSPNFKHFLMKTDRLGDDGFEGGGGGKGREEEKRRSRREG